MLMNNNPVRVLLIEDNPGDVRLIQEVLAEVEAHPIHLTCAGRLASGMEILDGGETDLVLLDLSLPDSDWRHTLSTVSGYAPFLPVIVLTGMEDEAMATMAVQQGAQDYIMKGEADAHTLSRAIHYAIQRQHARMHLQTISLTDALTGLYNRRGFMTLASQQVTLAGRAGTSLMLLFTDLDALKWVNDNLGHHTGDEFLKEAAVVLQETFRQSDVIGRVGGDELAVLAVGARPSNGELLLKRLRHGMARRNAQPGRDFLISMSVGAVYFNPDMPRPLSELMAEADRLMYEDKRRGKEARGQRPSARPNAG